MFDKLVTHLSLRERLEQQQSYNAGKLLVLDPLRGLYLQFEHSTEEKELLSIIIQRKGWYVGTKGTHTDRGKYMPIEAIIKILDENPDWIKTAKTAQKFGL